MPHKTCATVAGDVYVLAMVCVMNSVVVPWLVVALLVRRLEAAASVSTSTQPLSKLQARPPSMSALARRRFSLSDSALLGNAEGPLSTSNGGTVRGANEMWATRKIYFSAFHSRKANVSRPGSYPEIFACGNLKFRVVQNAPKPPPEVQGGPGQTLGASKKCVPTENPEERVA